MKRLTKREFIKKSRKIHGNKYNYSKIIYEYSNKKVIIICKKHGSFLQIPNHHLRGSGCPKCKNEKIGNICRKSDQDFILKASIIHNNKFNYSKINYINRNIKIKIICPIHGEFLQRPGDHLSGYGCSICSKNKKLTVKDFLIKSKEIHGLKYDYSKINYINYKTKIEIICSKHGSFFQIPNSHLMGRGCRKCGYEKLLHIISSKGENEFLDYVDVNKNDRQQNVFGYFIDGFDPKTNTIYEFLGDFWHGNPKKFDFNKTNTILKKSFKELYDNTFSRFYNLNRLGYNVKYIWENDWNKFKCGDENVPLIQEYNIL